MQSKVIAKAIVLNDDSHVLLLRRSSTDERRPGEWDFPGGGIEQGEDVIAGVARELYEEAGLIIPHTAFVLAYAATKPWSPTNESVTRLLFIVRVSRSADITLSFEHDTFKWATVATALKDFPQPFYAAGLAYADTHGLLA